MATTINDCKVLFEDVLRIIGDPKLNSTDYDDAPIVILVTSLLDSDVTRPTFLSLGSIEQVDPIIIFAYVHTSAVTNKEKEVWHACSSRLKQEVLTYNGPTLSDEWDPTSQSARFLLLADRDIAQWCLEHASETRDWPIVRLILGAAPAQWCLEHADEMRAEMEENGADVETLRALAHYRARMAKAAVRPLLIAQLAGSGASAPVAETVSNRYLMEYLVQTIANN